MQVRSLIFGSGNPLCLVCREPILSFSWISFDLSAVRSAGKSNIRAELDGLSRRAIAIPIHLLARNHGRGGGVGRGFGAGPPLGVGVGRGVAVGVAVAVAVAVAVGVTVAVGVDVALAVGVGVGVPPPDGNTRT